MNVQQISFNNNINRPEQKSNSGSVAFSSEPDKFESSNKKDNTAKYIFAGLGVVAAIVAIVKRKQIGEFFGKLFKRGEKTEGDTKPPVAQPKPKFKLPKPEFKYDEKNPIEFAKEKGAYIDSIVGYASRDKQTALGVMNQFDKYGSREQLFDLLSEISILKPENKTDQIANKYLHLYDKYTKNKSEVLTSPLSAIIEEYGNVLSKDSIMLIINGFERAGDHPGDLLDVRGFIKGDQHYHTFLSKFNPEDLAEIDKQAQDAEEVVRKRVYKD